MLYGACSAGLEDKFVFPKFSQLQFSCGPEKAVIQLYQTNQLAPVLNAYKLNELSMELVLFLHTLFCIIVCSNERLILYTNVYNLGYRFI